MKGIAKLVGIAIMVVLFLAVFALFLSFVFAAPATLTATVVNTVSNESISGATVSLINCSNTSHVLNSSLTSAGGVASIGIDTGWNFTLRISKSGFVTLNDTNNSNCYVFSSDSSLRDGLYPNNKFSFTVRVRDSQNQRPIPGANITIWKSNTPSENETISYNYNYNIRCRYGDQRVCNTTDAGDIVLFADAGTTTNYTINVRSESYNSTNVTYNGLSEGQNQNATINLRGASPVSGYITDGYNSQPVNGSVVSINIHTQPGQDQFSTPLNYSNAYMYNATTNANGYYIIYVPSDLIASRYYNLKINSTVYEVKIDRNPSGNNNGYTGGQQISSALVGSLNITVNVSDWTNRMKIENATVVITENSSTFSYTNYTNSTGGILIKIRNNTGYNVEVSKSGYNTNNSYTNQLGSQTLSITLLGAANITGQVINYLAGVAGDVGLNATAITISQSGRNYTATADSNGNFSLNIPTGGNYTIYADKTGYFVYTSTRTPSAGANALGKISLYGRTRLYGNVQDAEAGKYSSGSANRNLAGANVSIFDATNSITYLLAADSSGNYALNMSSNSVQFSAQFNRSGYFTETKTYPSNNTYPPREIDLGTAYLTGRTWVNGSVADAETAGGGTNIFISGVGIRFTYLNSNETLYIVQTNGSGFFSVKLGVTATYKIEVSKQGYDTRVFNGTGYEPYVNVSFENATNDYLRLNGSNYANGNVTDALSGYPVYNARVRIFNLNDENPTYWKDVNGSFYFRIPSTMNYKISSYASGYPEITDNNGGAGYTANLTKIMNLTAQFQAIVKDRQNLWGIKNTRVQLYHYFNQTTYSNTVNETKVNITVICPGLGPLAVAVNLNKTECLWYQNASYLNICNRSLTTSGGNGTFGTVANGTYDMFINASSVGCGNYSQRVGITAMGITHSYSFALNATNITLNITDPRYAGVNNATVYLTVNASKNCTTDASGICTVPYVPLGNQSFTANHTNYYSTSKNYTLANGLNNYTSDPLVLNPHPGNLSVVVYNSTLTVDDINVSLSNSSFANSTLTSGGWANFSVLVSFFNVTVNGTSQGYNYTNITNQYVIPDNVTILNITLGENTYLVRVLDGNGLAVNGSDVTVNYTAGNMALLGNGGNMTATTNTTGHVFFRRVIPGNYTLIINKTGFDTAYTENITLAYGSNTKTVVINDSQSPTYSNVSTSNITPNQGDELRLSVLWTDNAALSRAILQRNESGSWENTTIGCPANPCDLGSAIQSWSNFTLDSAYTSTPSRLGKMLWWKVIARDLAGNWNTTMNPQNFTIRDTQAPAMSISHSPNVPLGDQPVTFTSTGSDNVNITNISIYVDFVDVQSCVNASTSSYPTSCVYQSNPYQANTWHYYYTTAVDAIGNAGRDPASQETNTTKSATLANARSWPSAVVYGGTNGTYANRTFVFGGWDGSAYITAVQYYAAETETVTTRSGTTENMTNKRGMAGAWSSSVDEIIFLFGGYNDSYSRNIIKYNITSGNSTTSSTLLDDNFTGIAATTNTAANSIYIFGGFNGTNYMNWTRIFNPSTEALNSRVNLPSPRYAASAVYVNSTATFIIGGFNGSDISEIVLYNNGNPGTMTVAAYLPTGRFGTSAVYFQPNRKIYIFGGQNNNTGTYLSDIIEFDPATMAVTTKAKTIGAARSYTAAVFNPVNQTILVFGGESNTTRYTTIFEYNPLSMKRFWVDPNYAVNVNVRDSDGSAIENVSVNLSGEVRNTSASGAASFSVRSGSYNLFVNGTIRGYGTYNTTVSVPPAATVNVNLNETKLNVYVYNNIGQPVSGATVTLYESGGAVAKDADGNDVSGSTSANGWKIFSRMLPCSSCNLTISKPSCNPPCSNSTVISIVAGENKTVQIDPSVNSYYRDIINETITIRVNVTNNSEYNLSYVNVSLYDANGLLYASNLSDSNGISAMTIEPGAYNLTVDGRHVGFGSASRSIRIGKMVFANGTTGTGGDILLTVDGQPGHSMNVPGNGYYAKIDAPGYIGYDSFSTSTIFRGAYYDTVSSSNPNVNNSFRLNMNGTVFLNGTVTDKYICGTHNCNISAASVNVRFHGGAQLGDVRYTNTTTVSGIYSMYISPYTTESTIGNPISVAYDIEVIKSGYQNYDSRNDGVNGQGISFANGTNNIYNASMSGSGSAEGYAYNMYGNAIGSAPVRIKLYNTSYSPPYGNGDVIYSLSTDTSGQFSFTINPYYSPYRIELAPSNYESKLSGLYTGSQTGLEFRLYSAGHGGLTINVVADAGETPQGVNVNITGTERYNLTTDAAGQAVQMQLGSYEYNITVNGTHLGYGINSSLLNITSGNGTDHNVTLNATRINVTLANFFGGVVDNINVTVANVTVLGTTQSYSASNVSTNGSALFRKLPIGRYNLSFSGTNTSIYTCGNYSINNQSYACDNPRWTVINVTAANMLGNTTRLAFNMNETRIYFNITNETASGVSNLNVTAKNTASNETYTNSTYPYIFTLPAGNYTVYFNETQVYRKGFIPFNTSVEASLGNNTIVSRRMNDAEVRFNITNESAGLGSINITIKLNGTTATDGYNGNSLINLTDASGIAMLHNVIPTAYADGDYSYDIDGNSSGYGLLNGSLTVGLTGANISRSIEPVSVIIYVRNETGNALPSGVNVSITYRNLSVATNALGQNLTATSVTNNQTFRNLYALMNYTAVANSTVYYVRMVNFTSNRSNENYSITFTMQERKIIAYLYDLRNYTAGSVITENLTVEVRNQTGIVLNMAGALLRNTTTIGNITFSNISDSAFYNVTANSTASTGNYTRSLGTKVISTFTDNTTFVIHLKRNDMGYFNITTSPAEAAVELIYNNTVIDSGTSNGNGNLALWTNTSLYSTSLYLSASKSGYSSSTSGPYTIAEGEVQNKTVTLSAISPTTTGGGGGGVSGGGGACAEKWSCSNWSVCINNIQTRICTDSNSCNTTLDKPTTTRNCGADMFVEIGAKKMSAGRCELLPVKIRNTGNIYLYDMKLLRDSTSSCCIVTGMEMIDKLAPQEEKGIVLQVCAVKEAGKGSYSHAATFTSDAATESVSFSIEIENDYVEVLLTEINGLEAELDSRNATGRVRDFVTRAKGYAIQKRFAEAESDIEAIKQYLEGRLLPAGVEWMLVLLIPLAVGGALLILYLKTNIFRAGFKAIPRPYPLVYDKNLLLAELAKIEQRIARIDIRSLEEKEMKYYNRIKNILDNARYHISASNFIHARKALEELESHLKLLEYSMFGGLEEE